MARQLKLHGKVHGNDRKVCTIGILDDDNKLVSNEVAGVRLSDINDFFKRNRQLMPSTFPSDFTVFLATTGDECVSITEHPTLYRELGLHFGTAADTGKEV
jgi:hypothetical protein